MLLDISWTNNAILHDLKLDFRKPDGTPYKTIVIAGENGTGKTSVLSSINDLMKGKATPSIEQVTYEHNGDTYIVTPDRNNPKNGFYNRQNTKTNQNKYFGYDSLIHHPENDADETELRHYGCIYLSARSGFKTAPVKSSTTKQLDTEKMGDDEDYNYTEIKQLIVDLDEQDAQTYRKAIDETTQEGNKVDGAFVTKIRSESKMYRFTDAFNGFFGSKMNFKDVDHDNPDEKAIRFLKNDKLINIDGLSTGEKQIVFRGAYCLKNSKAVCNGLILIDEPELSMHPKWQRKILQYYRNLFTQNGEQTVQMIITTHSDHVVSEALSHKDDVKVIILKEENNSIIAHDLEECVLPRIQSSEVNYIAFGLSSLDYFLALYCRIQQISEESGYGNHITECDKFIMKNSLYDSSMSKHDKYNKTNFETLPTYIRNAICHPDSTRDIKETDVERCIVFLRKLCSTYPK